MGLMIQVQGNTTAIRDTLGRFRDNLPRNAGKDLTKIARIYSQELSKTVPVWRGRLRSSLKRIKKRGNKARELDIPDYGFALEYGTRGTPRPYFIGPDTKGRERVEEYLESKGGNPDAPYIRLRKVAWISPAMAKAKERMQRYFKGELEIFKPLK